MKAADVIARQEALLFRILRLLEAARTDPLLALDGAALAEVIRSELMTVEPLEDATPAPPEPSDQDIIRDLRQWADEQAQVARQRQMSGSREEDVYGFGHASGCLESAHRVLFWVQERSEGRGSP